QGFAGSLDVRAPSVVVANSARIDGSVRAQNPAGAFLCFRATSGDLTLSGRFIAHNGPSVVGGNATGNITADGIFTATPAGCVGFVAGGTLMTSGGSFNPAPSPSCAGNCP